MNFGQIQDEVESWLLDLPDGAATRVPGWINAAIKEATTRYNFKAMEAEEAATTVDQTRELFTKPATWKARRSEPYLINQDGSVTPISWAQSESQMLRTYAIQAPSEGNTAAVDEGEPRYLLERETTVEVFPLPDDGSDWDNGLYRMRVPYWAHMADLSVDADTNFFTDEMPYYCIWKAVELGLEWARDEQRAERYAQRAEREFVIAKNKDKLAKLPGRLTLETHKNVYAGEPRTGNRDG